MVSARLVDCPDSPEVQQSKPIPKMMFATGEEPVGVRMLRRRTVTDRTIRIKFVCLAILECVLLPTSLKMKISREHVKAIKDTDEFFAYPWGRLAFDLLMRNEVALSQDNVAVKGFALALQLVLVEAVPALTEVVQETCSSSKSDSEDDGLDPGAKFGKKQTLNPSHSRNVDKKRDSVQLMCGSFYFQVVRSRKHSKNPLSHDPSGISSLVMGKVQCS
ncbi:hypothetical protein HID58_051849 [Brassica napus]|uniref:DUF1985 domain-containing protein n=1 Tax=Brassica napus TaxID=3708 RepID=A0ABQ8ABJ2_BRANA|nr:hypothetical protein HID58_051849 [Brassica napus]